VEAVHHALRTCPQAKSFYDRKRAKRNGALATKALAAKWSKAAYYMMQRQENFDLTRVFGERIEAAVDLGFGLAQTNRCDWTAAASF